MKTCSNCKWSETCGGENSTNCLQWNAKEDAFQEIKLYPGKTQEEIKQMLFPQTSTTTDVKVPPTSKELAEAHWSYVESILAAHGVLNVAPFKTHYISAFIHGYKHGVESTEK